MATDDGESRALEDRLPPPARGLWLAQILARARLVLRDGEGHLGIFEHLGEMLDALTQPDAPQGWPYSSSR